jgi:extracellular elastinolytic metalloproteinase
MRCLLIASVAAGIASSVVAHGHDNGQRRRKSLGFGPIHPQAVYKSDLQQVQTSGFVPQSSDACPHATAKLFIESLLGSRLSDTYSYRIRKDSYTDKNTGITHVYVRQLVNGIEVTDGDMNINIKDGRVLSYGNSVSPLSHSCLTA